MNKLLVEVTEISLLKIATPVEELREMTDLII